MMTYIVGQVIIIYINVMYLGKFHVKIFLDPTAKTLVQSAVHEGQQKGAPTKIVWIFQLWTWGLGRPQDLQQRALDDPRGSTFAHEPW